ncbi:MAG: tetratricopeptide repeat protein [Flavobacteriales bacterium]|nr:tetratricopeptide repeat protein [Flavobacteriales bacterium]
MKNLAVLVFGSMLLIACGSNEEIKVDEAPVEENPIDTYEERAGEIDKYTQLLFADSLNFNQDYAEKLLAAYQEFIKHESFDTISLTYEFKAGELAKALNKPHVAIKHFNNLMDRRPTHRLVPMALFYKAMIVGDMLGEHENAKVFYQEFIEKYPDHPFAESAKASIAIEGKDLNEVIKEFEAKNANS